MNVGYMVDSKNQVHKGPKDAKNHVPKEHRLEARDISQASSLFVCFNLLDQDDDLFLTADGVRRWCSACLGMHDVDRARMDDLLRAMGKDPAAAAWAAVRFS
jgi:hypothetical protein